MIDASYRPAISTYCLVSIAVEGAQRVLEILAPEVVLKQLELRSGSRVIVQGLSSGADFFLRAGSGLEDVSAGRTPFTATIRFRNEPKILLRFLTAALKSDLRFQTIRTFGYRGTEESELIFEGTLPDRELHFVYRHNVGLLLDTILSKLSEETDKVLENEQRIKTLTLESVLPYIDDLYHQFVNQRGDKEASLVNHEVLRFARTPTGEKVFQAGEVTSTVYRLDIPMLRDRFLKIRVPLVAHQPMMPESRIEIARLGLAFDSMTVTVGLLRNETAFVLVFEGRDLDRAPPVTQAILHALPEDVNVDAISAYEYLDFDPDAGDERDRRELRPMGRIEMLCVTPEISLVQPEEILDELRPIIAKVLENEQRIKTLTLEPVRSYLDDLHRELVSQKRGILGSEQKGVRTFFELLNDRYIRREQLGEGASGIVYRYLDLLTLDDVAGKHFPRMRVGSAELNALLKPAKESRAAHLVELRDYFFHDNIPVVVTEFLPIILANHESNQKRDPSALAHQHPRNLREFVRMAVQICEGLDVLHTRKHIGVGNVPAVGYVHRDVKPENIGAAISKGLPQWKLIDFGLAKEYSQDVELTSQFSGTPEYSSPQAVRQERSTSNDIFALGVTFFEVLCGWIHPGTPPWLQRAPSEVTKYVAFLTKGSGEEPPGFDRKRFSVVTTFQDPSLSAEGLEALQKIIYSMMEMSSSRRIPSAKKAREEFSKWMLKYGAQLRP